MKFQTDIAVEVKLVTSSEVGSGWGKCYNSSPHISHKWLRKYSPNWIPLLKGGLCYRQSLSVKRRILFPSQFRVVFTRVWVNIVPSAGDISNCRLDLSVGPIFRRQSRLRSHAIIDIHRVSRPGQPAHSGDTVTHTGITTGEITRVWFKYYIFHLSAYLLSWLEGHMAHVLLVCIQIFYLDTLRPDQSSRHKDLLGYILG